MLCAVALCCLWPTDRAWAGSRHHAHHGALHVRHKARVAAVRVAHAHRRHAKGHATAARVQTGRASVYASLLRGRRMADGTRFDPASNAAASKTLPLGTTARVTNLQNGRSALVTVRDRGPYVAGRVLDVSPADARRLGMRHQGIAPVAIAPLRRHPHRPRRH